MTKVSFSVQANRLLEDLLEGMAALEALDDLDMDLVDGVLTVEFDDGSQIIINRHESAQQVWVASPLGPAHFRFDVDKNDWLDDRTGVSLRQTLEQALASKLGQAIELMRQ